MIVLVRITENVDALDRGQVVELVCLMFTNQADNHYFEIKLIPGTERGVIDQVLLIGYVCLSHRGQNYMFCPSSEDTGRLVRNGNKAAALFRFHNITQLVNMQRGA
eukprot:1987426-Pleurochrysis_carterae.AAC.4